jgi:integrase
MPLKPPSYRRQRVQGGHDRAFVEVNGRRHWLGRYGTDESRQRYLQVLAESQVTGGLISRGKEKLSIAQLADAFLEHARVVYRRADRTPTKEAANCEQALRPLRELYGSTDATTFTKKALMAVRCRMMELHWCRTYINRQIERIKRMFRWASENDVLPGALHSELRSVSGLRAGRSGARESERVMPVAEEHVDMILPFLSSPVAAIVRLMLLTGARSGEICTMRACDIDVTATPWEYKPATHKTAHRGHQRIIFLGPEARKVVEQFLTTNPQAYLFSPAAALAEVRAKRSAARKTPPFCGNRPGTNVQQSPLRQPGLRHTPEALAKAVYAACDKAFPPPPPFGRREKEACRAWMKRLSSEEKQQLIAWRKAHRFHPHQLRHMCATKLRREYGLDAVQGQLGHRTVAAALLYAERDMDAARRIIEEVG